MAQGLSDLFPELDWIQNADLRARVEATWKGGMKQGGWILDDLPRIPFTLLIPSCPVNLVDHTRAVTQIAVHAADVMVNRCGATVSVDRDALVAGGLLHDVGKLLEYSMDGGTYVKSGAGRYLRHPFSGVALAAKQGVPDAVLHIIACHSKEGDLISRTPEAVIVFHADFIVFEASKAALGIG